MSERMRRVLNPVLIFTAFFEQLTWTTILVLLPGALHDPRSVSLAVSAYSLSNMAGNIGFGHLADRLGRYRMAGAGLLGLSVTSLLHLLAPTGLWLVAVRFAHGLAAAAVAPASLAAVNDQAPDRRRGEAMARTGLVIAAASMTSPPVVGRLADRFGVAAAVGSTTAMLVIVGLWALAARREAVGSTAARRDTAEGPAPARAKSGEVRSEIDSSRTILAALIAFALMFGQNVLFYAFALRARHLGMAPSTTGILLSVFAAGSVIAFVPPFSRLVDRRGFRGPLLAGLAAAAIGLLGLGLAADETAMALSLLAYGLGFGLVFTATTALSGSSAGRQRSGLSFGFLTAAFSAGAVTGPLVTRTLEPWLSPFTVSGVVALLAAGLILVWARPRPNRSSGREQPTA